MTYMKRLVFHVFMLAVGGLAAMVALQILSRNMAEVAPVFSYLLMALFMALSLAVSQLLVGKVFPLGEEQTVAPAVRKQNWAWLRPSGDGVRSGFPLNRDHMLIGREVKCAIMLNDNSVSRQHSSITRLAEGFLLKDLGSSNGTYVNGQRVQEYLLQDGDQVSIGDIQFWFEAPADSGPLGGQGQGMGTQHSLGSGQGPGSGTFSGGGFSLDPSASGGGFGFGGDDEEEEENTEAWHPRPEDLR